MQDCKVLLAEQEIQFPMIPRGYEEIILLLVRETPGNKLEIKYNDPGK